jgi:esterase FrsA
MLAGYWDQDVFSPKERSEADSGSSSSDGKLMAIQSEPLYQQFDRALHEMPSGCKRECNNLMVAYS